ncbi:hypothetical protein [Nitratireductor sp. ZSWI3]|uniref:hypothetical protein n=1 Tax=Nitratireductor sp. ZSWI3 TaxID=2966359 RepID=UPI0035AEB5A9
MATRIDAGFDTISLYAAVIRTSIPANGPVLGMIFASPVSAAYCGCGGMIF